MIIVLSVLLLASAVAIVLLVRRDRTRPAPARRANPYGPAAHPAPRHIPPPPVPRPVAGDTAGTDAQARTIAALESRLAQWESSVEEITVERDEAHRRAGASERRAEQLRGDVEKARADIRRAQGETERLRADAQLLRTRYDEAKAETARAVAAARKAREEAENLHTVTWSEDEQEPVLSDLEDVRMLAMGGSMLPPLPEADPLAHAVPQQLPLSPDATADSTLDGADMGAVVVRAASVCGDRHRRRQQHRRDAVLLRMPLGLGDATLLSAVAAGAPDGAWSQSAAALACRTLSDQVQNQAASLVPWLAEAAVRDMAPPGERPGDGDPKAGDGADFDADPSEALRLITRCVGRAMRVEAKGRGWLPEPGADETGTMGVALTGLLSPLGDRPSRTHLAFGVGDGMVLRLRDRTWSTVFPLSDPGPGGAALLPGTDALMRWDPMVTREGDLLAVCTGPTAALLLHEVTGEWYAGKWGAGQPRLTSFLLHLNARVRAAVADRSLICLWDHSFATNAAEARHALR
ncbi:hypothetical protein [Streptomyces sp. CAU 1734]|uniref:hypothetical protein n=1 Tax=Streptomyces sp. CAU 1734 TaxID=3140360 RepID=UPI0032607CE5